MKRIPKGFQLGPHQWTVQIVSAQGMLDACTASKTSMSVNERPPLGLTVYDTSTIYVQRVTRSFPKVAQLHTFWHEYFHALFWSVGRERLARDEGLVDVCGGLQLQALQSATF